MKLPTSLSPVSDRPISIAHAAVTEAVTQNWLTFRVALIFLAFRTTNWALKAAQRSQKLSRSTRLSPTSSKTLASLHHGHFPQRCRGGNICVTFNHCSLGAGIGKVHITWASGRKLTANRTCKEFVLTLVPCLIRQEDITTLE